MLEFDQLTGVARGIGGGTFELHPQEAVERERKSDQRNLDHAAPDQSAMQWFTGLIHGGIATCRPVCHFHV